MKKDLAEVKAHAEAIVDSNHMRDTYVDKEQDKFFCQLNRQQVDIDALKDRMEWLELRVRALELENKSLSAHLDSMVDKLCFCTWGRLLPRWLTLIFLIKERLMSFLSRLIEPSPSLSTLMNLWIICCTLRPMLNRAFLNKQLLSVQQTFLLWSQRH